MSQEKWYAAYSWGVFLCRAHWLSLGNNCMSVTSPHTPLWSTARCRDGLKAFLHQGAPVAGEIAQPTDLGRFSPAGTEQGWKRVGPSCSRQMIPVSPFMVLLHQLREAPNLVAQLVDVNGRGRLGGVFFFADALDDP